MAAQSSGAYVPSEYRPTLRRAGRTAGRPFENIGRIVTFIGDVLAGLPHTLRAYRKQTMAAFTEVTWGNGSILVGGGIATVMAVLGVTVGGMIGILGVTSLQSLNLSPMAGLITGYAATREMAPIIAAVGFAAQAGCRMTAEIGSMRISEEIDALEAQAIRPIPFVVGTRVIAGVTAIVPFYLVSLCVAYLTSRLVVSGLYGQSAGAYDRYVEAFVSPVDVIYSTIKVVVFALVIIIAHTYYGFFASGGPEGVGVASGRAIRASLVLIVTFDMLLSLLFWGLNSGLNFA
ncbi:MAG TPA: ABC transporter permease [Gordonia sp. (in: high G+C Gram-positive bacteria)]|uniref:MlaE family ABC transporter permease n=1 Tax=unclassified Gordonia (in: high G+C Gram-positive bacteria) TaxID=2657482 RepID=UPI000FAA5D7A|nr:MULTISPECIES: ABC transporter permease [unclassified Gordonia (in: high G+C Gram-positive bacteria)]RUP36979.1 MAG: ABC transporter permease [Gordonia sp. (in: high G+C Gram-positive bacteria)]HNP55833.1 ABC transporter permease [Gordonia sp. (in: high G+C Gram-positive bacteria)]HRC50944.1 ABC transporter permease [Gordonia sp. (in: high G+C Gram-positive bacteria)]